MDSVGCVCGGGEEWEGGKESERIMIIEAVMNFKGLEKEGGLQKWCKYVNTHIQVLNSQNDLNEEESCYFS